MTVRYPNIQVVLIGEDGNAFNVLGLVQRALKEADVPVEDRAVFMAEATSGNYDHLLGVVQDWVEVR